MNQALNRGNWPAFEASALKGEGVFETLKGISKLTLIGLKKRLAKTAPSEKAPAVMPGSAPPAPAAPTPAAQKAPPPAQPAAAPASSAQPPASAAPPLGPAPPQRRPAPADTPSGTRRQVDILAELEKIRRQAMGAGEAGGTTGRAASNGRSEIAREIQLTMSRANFSRARRFSVSFQVEDEANQVVDTFRDQVELQDLASLDKLLVRLNIALNSEE
jgi:hypothetical protein